MPDTGPISIRLFELRRRFEEDPGSPVALQLAEEERRVGRSDEAVQVLEASLERNPNYLSARVLLGRSLLDLGQADEALLALGNVLERDPQHLVASKLLIEAHLKRSDGVLARRQLERYRSLQPTDPEIDELSVRIDGLLLAPAEEPQETPPLSMPPAVAPPPVDPFPGLAAWMLARSQRHYGRAVSRPLPVTTVPEEEAPAPSWVPPSLTEAPHDDTLDDTVEALLEGDAAVFGALSSQTLEVIEPTLPPTPLAPTPLDPPSVEAQDEAPELATVTLAELYLTQGHTEEAARMFLRILDLDPQNTRALAGLKAIAEQLSPAEGDPVADLAEEAAPLGSPLSTFEPLAAVVDAESIEVSSLAVEAAPEVEAEPNTARRVSFLKRYLQAVQTRRKNDAS
jgi:tetratricopeptide (TPR) repeat protein